MTPNVIAGYGGHLARPLPAGGLHGEPQGAEAGKVVISKKLRTLATALANIGES